MYGCESCDLGIRAEKLRSRQVKKPLSGAGYGVFALHRARSCFSFARPAAMSSFGWGRSPIRRRASGHPLWCSNHREWPRLLSPQRQKGRPRARKGGKSRLLQVGRAEKKAFRAKTPGNEGACVFFCFLAKNPGQEQVDIALHFPFNDENKGEIRTGSPSLRMKFEDLEHGQRGQCLRGT
jgi:hypothetical protein